jgi:monoamine oxidase
VLRAARLRFEPMPAGRDAALSRLAQGPVEKVVLRLREAFWNERTLRPRGAQTARRPTFWHSRVTAFPTVWTSAPDADAVLTAWAGGPAAQRLRGASLGLLVERAVDSIATRLGRPRRAVDDALVAAHRHDWQGDPFSLGAYSYVEAGGRGAARHLAAPVEGTLILAGEALAATTGTVEAALASGTAAARRLTTEWSRRRPAPSSARRSTRSDGRRS